VADELREREADRGGAGLDQRPDAGERRIEIHRLVGAAHGGRVGAHAEAFEGAAGGAERGA
jgi:hypothetical protein